MVLQPAEFQALSLHEGTASQSIGCRFHLSVLWKLIGWGVQFFFTLEEEFLQVATSSGVKRLWPTEALFSISQLLSCKLIDRQKRHCWGSAVGRVQLSCRPLWAVPLHCWWELGEPSFLKISPGSLRSENSCKHSKCFHSNGSCSMLRRPFSIFHFSPMKAFARTSSPHSCSNYRKWEAIRYEWWWRNYSRLGIPKLRKLLGKV